MKWMLALLLAIGMVLVPKNALSEQKKVVVIDTGLDLTDPRFSDVLCKSGHRDFTGQGITDVDGHGTFVAGLISHGVRESNYCMVIVKFYHRTGSSRAMVRSLRHAFKLKPEYINISGGGDLPIMAERELIKENPNTTLVVAAGNEGKLLKDGNCFYPACYDLPNITVVGSIEPDGSRAKYSNYGSKVTSWEWGTVRTPKTNGGYSEVSGTSFSTAIKTRRLIYEKTYNN